MDPSIASLPPGDPKLISTIVDHLKSQGLFDQFRKHCLSDIDTKPGYQNLRQRVEGYVANFLEEQQWRPDLNKNQLRDSLRRSINESGMLAIGVDRIVEQVVNPKVYQVFYSEIATCMFKLLGKDLPSSGSFMQKCLDNSTMDTTNPEVPGEEKTSLKAETDQESLQKIIGFTDDAPAAAGSNPIVSLTQSNKQTTSTSESGDSKSSDSKSSDSKSGDSKSDDSKSVDSKSGDLKSGDSKPGDSKSDDLKSDDSKSGDSKSGDSKPLDSSPSIKTEAEAEPPTPTKVSIETQTDSLLESAKIGEDSKESLSKKKNDEKKEHTKKNPLEAEKKKSYEKKDEKKIDKQKANKSKHDKVKHKSIGDSAKESKDSKAKKVEVKSDKEKNKSSSTKQKTEKSDKSKDEGSKCSKNVDKSKESVSKSHKLSKHDKNNSTESENKGEKKKEHKKVEKTDKIEKCDKPKHKTTDETKKTVKVEKVKSEDKKAEKSEGKNGKSEKKVEVKIEKSEKKIDVKIEKSADKVKPKEPSKTSHSKEKSDIKRDKKHSTEKIKTEDKHKHDEKLKNKSIDKEKVKLKSEEKPIEIKKLTDSKVKEKEVKKVSEPETREELKAPKISPIKSEQPKVKPFEEKAKVKREDKSEMKSPKRKGEHSGESRRKRMKTDPGESFSEEGNKGDSSGDWSDVTVSSVHTSDLSDYDDHISLTDSEIDGGKGRSSAASSKSASPVKRPRGRPRKDQNLKQQELIKKKLSLYQSQIPVPSKFREPKVEPKPEPEDAEPRREMRRQRKVNPRYSSDDFASIFSKGKDKLQFQQDEENEQTMSEDDVKESSVKPVPRGRKSTCDNTDSELPYSPRSDVTEPETPSRRLSKETDRSEIMGRPSSPKSDLSGELQSPRTPESSCSTESRRRQHYDSSDLYKPRPSVRGGRRNRQSERYDDSDLYKPRSLVSSSRRARGGSPNRSIDLSPASSRQEVKSSPGLSPEVRSTATTPSSDKHPDEGKELSNELGGESEGNVLSSDEDANYEPTAKIPKKVENTLPVKRGRGRPRKYIYVP